MTIKENISFHEPVLDVGTWRKIYLKFLNELSINSICEVGSGHPSFLEIVNARKKLAIDFGDDFKSEFLKRNIEFLNIDLDNDSLDIKTNEFDVVVCSDVFEHLLKPERTLNFCKNLLNDEGLFFSHVPNEFNFYRIFGVMFMRRQSVFFHNGKEQSNPHLRRFTDIGYHNFLENEFTYNIYISDLNYKGVKSLLSKINIPIPFGFQFGPTYISTNSKNKLKEINSIRSSL